MVAPQINDAASSVEATIARARAEGAELTNSILRRERA